MTMCLPVLAEWTILPGWLIGSDGDLYVTAAFSAQIFRFGAQQEGVFSVTLSPPSNLPVTVDYNTAENTALAGSDYTSSSGTVTFAPGVTTRTIRVPTIDDAVEESTENFFVDLSAATGALIQDNQGEVTIVDDDAGRLPGDANLDGRVDATDLTQVGLNWQRSDGVGWAGGDFTADGRVDAADLNVLAQNWLVGISAAAPAADLPARRVPRAPLAQGDQTNAAAADVVMAVTHHSMRIPRSTLKLSSRDFATSDHPNTALSADRRPAPKRIRRLTPPLRPSAADQALLDVTVDDGSLENDLLANLALASQVHNRIIPAMICEPRRHDRLD